MAITKVHYRLCPDLTIFPSCPRGHHNPDLIQYFLISLNNHINVTRNVKCYKCTYNTYRW